MPYFQWKGISLTGMICSGKNLARTKHELESYLLEHDIALLSWRIPKMFLFKSMVHYKVEFFKQLGLLLKSGIFVDQALALMAAQIKNPAFKLIVMDILQEVQNGISLSNALKHYPQIFDVFSVQLIESGQESGKLMTALQELTNYQEMLMHFKKKLSAVLLAPFITFIFFLIVACIILMVIVPTFAQLFLSTAQTLNSTTVFILNTSSFLRSIWALVSLMCVSLSMGLVIYIIKKNSKINDTFQRFLLIVPGVGSFVKSIWYVYFFKSLALLTQSGVHLMDAFTIAHESISHRLIKARLLILKDALEHGHSFSQALNEHKKLFPETIVTLLAIGQESNCLPVVFDQISFLYQQSIQKTLTRVATLIQPLLMIVLGLLIAMLVFALYIPLFNISTTIA